jgi:outer membrane biosynthesis protein TonB
MLDNIKYWLKNQVKDENRFGAMVTGLLHLLLLIIALLYHIHMDVDTRPAYIEVTLGEFQTGTVAEYAEQQPEEVATRPDPAEVEPEEPDPEVPEPEEVPEQVTEETAKPVDLTEQVEEIDAEVIETPDTDQINPEVVQQQQQEEVIAPPRTEEDEQIQEGEEISGTETGSEGEINVEQGTGNDAELSSPYSLQWEGDLDRSPMVQPLPENTEDVEAVITVRFEVFPDGSIGRIIPLIKMNPELERQVMSTLRSWRFSRLPSGVPQEPQWGNITFRFVMD